MSVTYECDVCRSERNAKHTIVVEIENGEYPHDGSTMYKDVDMCVGCVNKKYKRLKPIEYHGD